MAEHRRWQEREIAAMLEEVFEVAELEQRRFDEPKFSIPRCRGVNQFLLFDAAVNVNRRKSWQLL